MEANKKFNVFLWEAFLISYTGRAFAEEMYSRGYNDTDFRFYPEKELLC